MSPSEHLTPEDLIQVRRYALVIEWSDRDQKFLAIAPDLPGAITHGATREEAATMGEEVIATWLQGEENPPTGRFTAMSYQIRPEADAPPPDKL